MNGLLINISNHPVFQSPRKIEIIGYQQLWSEEQIKVFTICHHYNENGDVINTQSIKSFERILIASNIRKVDVDGMELIEVVEGTGTTYQRIDDKQTPAEVIGQFDFFNSLVMGNSINVPALLTQFVLIDDQVKKNFDK